MNSEWVLTNIVGLTEFIIARSELTGRWKIPDVSTEPPCIWCDLSTRYKVKPIWKDLKSDCMTVQVYPGLKLTVSLGYLYDFG